ncbi:MAG: VOC family protein [Tepidiformaceae bacterium]
MSESNRLVAVVVEVSDLDRSVRLYVEGFGLSLHASDHDQTGDRWIGGRHAAVSWTDGAFLHFALYQAKHDGPTKGTQLGFAVGDIDQAHAKAIEAGAVVVHEPRDEPWAGPRVTAISMATSSN